MAELDVNSLNDEQKGLRRTAHETLAKATDDYGRRLSFNTVVSAVMSLMNQLNRFEDTSDQGHAVVGEALTIAVLVMSPITPHICHQLWWKLKQESLDDALWMEVDEQALEKLVVEIVVQINGRLRGKLEVPPDESRDELEALAMQISNIRKHTGGKEIRKVIHVPNRLLNFVVS